MLGVCRSQSSLSTLGLPTLSEGGHLSQKPAFFPESMEHILWLCNWKPFLLRDGGWHVTQPDQRWAWHSVSLCRAGHSWYLLDATCFAPCCQGSMAESGGLSAFPESSSVSPESLWSQCCQPSTTARFATAAMFS